MKQTFIIIMTVILMIFRIDRRV